MAALHAATGEPPSSLEVAEDILEEEQGFKVMPESPNPHLFESHLVVVKKIKRQQLQVPPGKVQPPHQVVEHSMFYPYAQAELVDLGSWIQQKSLEPISPRLLCLWNVGVDGSCLGQMGTLASLCLTASIAECIPDPR